MGAGTAADDRAERSGVSRRMVVNVEQGVTNASIATLLRLSTALRISLAALVDVADGVALSVRRKGEHHVLWDWTLGPHDVYVSEQHSTGTRELLHMLAGSVTLTVADESVALGVGDGVWFAGDQPHTYANHGKRTARFSLSVYQPGVGA